MKLNICDAYMALNNLITQAKSIPSNKRTIEFKVSFITEIELFRSKILEVLQNNGEEEEKNQKIICDLIVGLQNKLAFLKEICKEMISEENNIQ